MTIDSQVTISSKRGSPYGSANTWTDLWIDEEGARREAADNPSCYVSYLLLKSLLLVSRYRGRFSVARQFPVRYAWSCPRRSPELSWIKFANEISSIPRVRVADRPRFPSPSAVLGPVHASAPRKIHYALSVRHWRHLLDAVDHPGLCRCSATFHQLASLMPKLRVRNPRFAVIEEVDLHPRGWSVRCALSRWLENG